jgi:hypothetical protein
MIFFGRRLNPFGLSLSKPSSFFESRRMEGRPFDKLRANGGC